MISFKSLDIDKSEQLEDIIIKHGDSSSASFMAYVKECISERESWKFEEGLNTKVKLDMYKGFGKSVEFKKFLHGICIHVMQEVDFCLSVDQDTRSE